MGWIGNIENKAKAMRQLYDALTDEGEPGFFLYFRTLPSGMQTADAAAELLERVARDLREGYTGGPLMDVNGNTVGEWEFTSPLPESDDE